MDPNPSEDGLRCRVCGQLSLYLYCEVCSKDAKCHHGNKLDECDHCDHLSDQAYDAARESRGR